MRGISAKFLSPRLCWMFRAPPTFFCVSGKVVARQCRLRQSRPLSSAFAPDETARPPPPPIGPPTHPPKPTSPNWMRRRSRHPPPATGTWEFWENEPYSLMPIQNVRIFPDFYRWEFQTWHIIILRRQWKHRLGAIKRTPLVADRTAEPASVAVASSPCS